MYLAASMKNEVNCGGSDSCKYSQINCGIPDNIPSAYSLSDFEGHINECSIYLSNNAISDSSSIKCFHDIDECNVYAQTNNDDFKESTFTCELSPKNSLCSMDCYSDKACGSKTSRFFCNAPNCECNGNGCSGLRRFSQDTAPPSTSILGETVNPTMSPSLQPTHSPTEGTKDPSAIPTSTPSKYPSSNPSHSPTEIPSIMPTFLPSEYPSQLSSDPTMVPTFYPSLNTSLAPTNEPTFYHLTPTMEPTVDLSRDPTENPTFVPTLQPTSDKITKDYTVTIEIDCDSSDSKDTDCIDETEIINIILNALSEYYNVTIINTVLDGNVITIKLSLRTDTNQVSGTNVIANEIENEFEQQQQYGAVKVNVSAKDIDTSPPQSNSTSTIIIIILSFAIILLCCGYFAYFYGKRRAKKEMQKENSLGIKKIFRFSEVDKADKNIQMEEDVVSQKDEDGPQMELTVPKVSIIASDASDLESIASIKQLPLSPANDSDDDDLEALENLETIQIDMNEEENEQDGDDETDSSKLYATDNKALTISPGEEVMDIEDGGNKTTIDNAVHNALMPPSNLKLIDMDSDDAVLATPGSLDHLDIDESSDDDVNLNSADDLEGSYNYYE